ncbi:hypothetical protein HBI37_056040 [Parastagonospora nodorum]|nr:hypothetical protein HBI05_080280 [Parastagonospora nodorum]KAH6349035.1 hypothetical protein HBI37_056040 [Parastagonospora nodorum]
MSRSSTDIGNGRPLLDSASSAYSHQISSAYGASDPEVKHKLQPARSISRLDGIVNNPYGYTTEVAEQTTRTETNQMQQTITTTASRNINAHRKALPAPPGNDQDRGNNFAGSLHKSRPQLIWFRPEGATGAGCRIDLIAESRATNSRIAAKLERSDEEDEYIDQTKREIRLIKIQDIGAARNTFQSKREKQSDNEMLDARRSYRNEQDRIRAAGWQASKEKNIHKFTDIPRHRDTTSKDILSRAKYQFEPDSDDEELEDVIEGTLDEIAGVAQQLKGLVLDQGKELEQHNGRLGRISRTADKADDGLASNRLRLGRFY